MASPVVIHDTTIVTGNDAGTILYDAALAVEGRRIIALGPSAEVLARYASATRVDLDYIGFASTRRFQGIVSSPNFGRGLTATGPGSASLSCTSGLPIFETFQVSQDCIDAITSISLNRP